MASKEQKPLSKSSSFFNFSHNRELTNEDVANQARYLLLYFVHDLMKNDGLEDVPVMEQLQGPGTPPWSPPEYLRELGRALKNTGDDLEKDQELQEKLSKVKPDADGSVILRVAQGLFKGGIVTWGRVLSLFYFAYKVCAKALNQISLIRGVINVIVDFMREYVVQWIRDRGGWEGIREHFGTTNLQMGAVFLSGALVCAGLYMYKNWT